MSGVVKFLMSVSAYFTPDKHLVCSDAHHTVGEVSDGRAVGEVVQFDAVCLHDDMDHTLNGQEWRVDMWEAEARRLRAAAKADRYSEVQSFVVMYEATFTESGGYETPVEYDCHADYLGVVDWRSLVDGAEVRK